MLGRVLVLSASAGAGHLRAAEAIEKAIRIRGAATDVQHLDVLKYTNQVFRHFYSKAYIDLVNKAPEVLGWLYDYMDDPKKNDDPVRMAFDRLNANPFIRYLQRYQPDVAICTHFLPSGIISWLKGAGKIKVLNSVVVTDFDVHAMWLCPHAEQYFVALEETKVHLKALGVAEPLTTVSGIPIDPVFAVRKDKRAMRRKHGLEEGRFTILVSAGGCQQIHSGLDSHCLARRGGLRLDEGSGRSAVEASGKGVGSAQDRRQCSRAGAGRNRFQRRHRSRQSCCQQVDCRKYSIRPGRAFPEDLGP